MNTLFGESNCYFVFSLIKVTEYAFWGRKCHFVLSLIKVTEYAFGEESDILCFL